MLSLSCGPEIEDYKMKRVFSLQEFMAVCISAFYIFTHFIFDLHIYIIHNRYANNFSENAICTKIGIITIFCR